VLGYEFPSRRLRETVAARMETLYGWKISPEAVVATPGIIAAFNAAAWAFCAPGDGFLIQPPVYPPFFSVSKNLGLVEQQAQLQPVLRGAELRYEIDFDVFRAACHSQNAKTRMALLCNPHNPVGRAFTADELRRMAEICLEKDTLIVSDEIHSELLLGGAAFTPLAKLSREIEKQTVTLVAPSKTFNVPGLFCGFAVIPNAGIRKRFEEETNRMTLHVNSLGMVAAQAAFSGECDGWLAELRRYLTANRDFLAEYLGENMPGTFFTIPDATYLGWLDFRQTKIEGSPYQFFLKNARVALSEGRIFGEEGAGHVRLNFGAPRKTLAQGLERMRKALKRA
jgi:cystathionine beta-lyase